MRTSKWDRDGSGLVVRRCRGKTHGQSARTTKLWTLDAPSPPVGPVGCSGSFDQPSPIPYRPDESDVISLYSSLECGHCLMMLLVRVGMEDDARTIALEIANRIMMVMMPTTLGQMMMPLPRYARQLRSSAPITEYRSALKIKRILWEASRSTHTMCWVRNSKLWGQCFEAMVVAECVCDERWTKVAWHAAEVDHTENRRILADIRQRFSSDVLLANLVKRER
jgi:hypothetical protein